LSLDTADNNGPIAVVATFGGLSTGSEATWLQATRINIKINLRCA